MSRAFVKEPDGDQAETDLPVRPQSKHPNYITMKGLEKQKERLHELILECSALKKSNTLADKNKIKVDQQDIYAEIQRKALSMPGYEKALFDFYQKNPKAVEALAGPVFENKAVAYMLDKEITRTEKKLTKDQFDKLIDKENNKAVI